MLGFVSPAREFKAFTRVIAVLLIVATACPPLYAQSIEGRTETDEMTRTPEIIQAQGGLATALEGPIDPDQYVLGPSDQLLMILKGPATEMHYLRVFPEGNVILPNYGSFEASGLTLTRFTERVRVAMRKYYRNIDIDVQLSVPRSFIVYVLGEVNGPGPVQVTAMSRVSHALARAGGLKGGGSSRLIEIREAGKEPRVVDQFMFLETGDFEYNPTLKEGQMIFVPLKEITATVIGEARKTGQYEMVPGETAEDLFEFAKGIGPLGNGSRILRERIIDGKAKPIYDFAIENADTVGVSHMDVFVVDDIMSYGGEIPVQVVGGGGRNGIFPVSEPEPLKEFLYRLWRIEPTAFDLESAVLDRKTGEGMESEQVPFSVRDVLAGGAQGDMMVQPGDYIVIPPAINQVFLAGQVVNPGPVPFQPGLTAERYVTLAGGPNNDGSYGKMKIVSREGVERDADKESIVYRGDTIVIGTKTSKIFGALWVGVVSLTGLAVAIVALSNSLNNN